MEDQLAAVQVCVKMDNHACGKNKILILHLGKKKAVADATAAEQPKFDAIEVTTKQANEALVVENPHSSHTIERLRGFVGQLRSAIKQCV